MKEGRGELQRIMGLRHLVLFGIAFVTPTAPFPMFGIVSSVSNGHMALAYMVAMAAMALTAVSYGRMASVFPAAGSAYTYTRRTLHPMAGFLTGWTMLLDYVLLPLLSVIYLALTAGRWAPQVPHAVWLVLFAAAITGMNLLGMRFTNRANFAMTGVMMVVVGAFGVLSVSAVQAGVGEGTLFSWKPLYNPGLFALEPLMAATSIAAFSFLGFDGISTLAEDARNPKRDIGRATLLVCLICGLLFIGQAYLGQLVWPDTTSYPQTETAFLDVSRLVGGAVFFSVVSAVLLVAGVASAVNGQASAARLLLGMGRDGILPPRVFAYVHPKHSTPTYSILVMSAITLGGGLVLSFQLAAEAINFGALLGFIGVNVSVISHFYVRGGERRGAGATVRNLLLPGLGVAVCGYIFFNLSTAAKTIGAGWCVAGLIYTAWQTRGFKRGLTPGANLPAEPAAHAP